MEAVKQLQLTSDGVTNPTFVLTDLLHATTLQLLIDRLLDLGQYPCRI